MATNTPNFNLRKPATNDLVDVETDINDNLDTIDTEIQQAQDSIATHIADPAGAHASTAISHGASDVSEALTELAARSYPSASSIAIIGDSITLANGGLLRDGTTVNYKKEGYFTWANIFLNHRMDMKKNAGIGSETTTQIAARLSGDILAMSPLPAWCLVQGGTNDLPNGVSAATIQTNLQTMYEALLAAGIRVVACTVTPSTFMNTAPIKQALQDVNKWIRDYARANPGIVLADLHGAVADPTTGDPVTGMTYDGVHPDVKGASVMGLAVANALAPFVPINDYVSNDNDADNLLANPVLAGDTAGVATSWAVGGAGTATASKVARTDGVQGDWQQLRVTVKGGADAGSYIEQTVSTGYAEGENVYGQIEFETDDDYSEVTRFYLLVTFNGPGTTTMDMSTDGAGANDFPNIPASGVFQTPTVPIPVGTTGIWFRAIFYGLGTVRFGRAALRVVA